MPLACFSVRWRAKARSHGGSELILRDIAAVRAEIGTMEGPDDLTA